MKRSMRGGPRDIASSTTAFPAPSDAAPLPGVAGGPTSGQATPNRMNEAKEPFSVFCWNVRSVKDETTRKLTAHELHRYKADVVCLSETRINGVNSEMIVVPGTQETYQFLNSGIDDGSGLHGVGFMLNKRAQRALIAWEPVSPRLALLRLKGTHFNISIVSVYAPTRDATDSTKDAFYATLENTVRKCPKRDYLIVAGDWNGRVGPQNQAVKDVIGRFSIGQRCENGERLLNFARNNNLMAANTMFQHKNCQRITWRSNDHVTTAQIDYVLIPRKWRSSVLDARAYRGACTGSNAGSDHTLVGTKIRLRLSTRKRKAPRKKLNIAKLGVQTVKEQFQLRLSNRFEALSQDGEDPNTMWKELRTVTTDVASEVLGFASVKKEDWISQKTVELVEVRRSLSHAPRSAQAKARKQVKQSARRDRKAHWENVAVQLEQAARNNDTRKQYQILKEATGQKTCVSDTIRDSDGSLIRDIPERVERWRGHFTELLNPTGNGRSQSVMPQTVPKEPYEVNVSPPTAEEIVEAIKSLKRHKSPGEDGLPAEIFKACPRLLASQLQPLYKKVWETKSFPSDWKISIVLPFFKKGDKTDCRNYRGISLVDIAGKIFAIILLRRFQQARDDRSRENQAGFRSGRGCTDQTFTLRLILQQCERYNLPIINIFVDFIAAFDSVTRSKLWVILVEDGMPEEFVQLLQAYYEGCISKVRVYGEESAPFEVESGVKQGCVLSPVLFNYCVDWILENALRRSIGIPVGLNVTVTDLDYADDVDLLATDVAEAQSSLDNVAMFAELIGLRINTKKTKTMALNVTQDYQIHLYGETLEKVDSFTYLGSEIDSKGTCDLDIQKRIDKAQAVFWQLRRHLWTRREISIKTKVCIYKTAVRSILFYGAESWSIKAAQERAIETFDHRCLRYILRVRYADRVSNAEVRRRCSNIERATAVIKSRRLRWLGHVLRRPNDRLVKQVLLAEPLPSWRRRPGGQLKNWWTTVKKDLEPAGGFRRFGRRWDSCWLEFAKELAQDRCNWDTTVRQLVDAG